MPSASTRLVIALLLGGAVAGLGCDTNSHGQDASPSTSVHTSQVSVRLDLPSGSAPSVSILAFRAEAIDMASSDVLGAVDPLVAPAPESSCELRDVAGVARMVRAQGGSLNLQELGGVALQADAEQSLLPEPRVYPPLADVVSGVIAEAGPRDLGQLPSTLMLNLASSAGEHSSVELTLPSAPSVLDSSENPLDTGAHVNAKGDLILRVSGPARTFLEIRPFGAPAAIACAASASGWVVVPHDLLVRLMASAGRAPVSFEAVWRESRLVQTGGESTRVSFEARSSAVLEIRP